MKRTTLKKTPLKRAQITRWTLARILLMAFIAATASFAQTDPVTFTVINGTSSAIVEFYATDPGSEDWEEDILGVDVLAPGDEVEITIDDFREDCHYDFLAVFSDDTELVHEDVEVCDGEEYVYTDD